MIGLSVELMDLSSPTAAGSDDRAAFPEQNWNHRGCSPTTESRFRPSFLGFTSMTRISGFPDCDWRAKIEIPPSVRIGDTAFQGCDSLREVSFPKCGCLKEIQGFGSDGQFTKVLILASVERISDQPSPNVLHFAESFSLGRVPHSPLRIQTLLFTSDDRDRRLC
jgi:hypothetical protein